MKIIAVVRDKHTKEPIPYTPVWLGETLSVTDEHGEAAFEVPKGKRHIKIRATDYEPLDQDIEVTRPVKLGVSLRSERLE